MAYIVVTNDDGVDAPGICMLAQAMKAFGDVQVIAPAVNQSASGHKKTLFTDIPFKHTQLADGTPAMAIHGSPADCIAVAALGAIRWAPDLVVSGINRGANMGQDITYSGTVTAALEASIHGVPAIAFSLDQHDANHPTHYQEAARVAHAIVKNILGRKLPPFTILNVNIPPVNQVKGIRLTRQGLREYLDELEKTDSVYRIVGDPPGGRLDEEGTDLWAVANGYVSITPLHLDMTAHQFMADVANWDLSV
ncbi:MAG: 5'/3'-nucleotidase SurE [Phototrophicales bacterium]|nr:MAG: 5'/3'-nucleotidase SurE [Phototrophicales bacterium]RMG77342.1 MAG: 5'/3'-nucleotidase SurE [Chloroflexota bacterium]